MSTQWNSLLYLGLTFSIWGIIYTFEGAFSLFSTIFRSHDSFISGLLTVYQVLPQNRENPSLVPARFWIVAVFLLNTLWLPIFQYLRFWLAWGKHIIHIISTISSQFVIEKYLGVIAAYLYALYRASCALRINYISGATTWKIKTFVFTGISVNMAWVVVATLVNTLVCFRQSVFLC